MNHPWGGRGVKGGRQARKADNLTAMCKPAASTSHNTIGLHASRQVCQPRHTLQPQKQQTQFCVVGATWRNG
jgi:hypothetical protein